MTYLILDGADVDLWQRHHSGGLLIPAGKRPTVLQANRERAEAEALRLGTQHPGLFVIFAPVAMAKRVPVATHVNIRGDVLHTANTLRLLPIGDPLDDVPF